jgi:hypothetical protein
MRKAFIAHNNSLTAEGAEFRRVQIIDIFVVQKQWMNRRVTKSTEKSC